MNDYRTAAKDLQNLIELDRSIELIVLSLKPLIKERLAAGNNVRDTYADITVPDEYYENLRKTLEGLYYD